MHKRRYLQIQEAISRGYGITREGDFFAPRGAKGFIKNGYMFVSINLRSSGFGQRDFPFHQFQAVAKFGKKVIGLQVRHLDGNSLNNRWSNIAIGTQSQNMMDRPLEKRHRGNRPEA